MVHRILHFMLLIGLLALLALTGCRSDDPPETSGSAVDSEAEDEARSGDDGARTGSREADDEEEDSEASSAAAADEGTEDSGEKEAAALREIKARPDEEGDAKKGSGEDRGTAASPKRERPSLPEGVEVRRLERKKTANYRMEVLESTIAEVVEDRRPKGKGRHFGADVGQVWAWVKVSNRGEEANPITMIWRHEGKQRFKTELNVGVSKGWRTWTRKKIARDQTGDWTVEVRDPGGSLLDELKFTIGGKASLSRRALQPPRTIQ